MMARLHLFLLLLLLGVVAGCVYPTQEIVLDEQNSKASDLEARLIAANEISDSTEHDSALAALANDAANQGDGSITRSAISGIRSINERDRAAADAAMALAQNGNAEDATSVAKLISSISIKDETLSRIAKGK